MPEIIFMGSGTSHGVPMIACDCGTCRSDDPRDKRLNASILIKWEQHNILIDCGRDFRHQAIREGLMSVEGVLLTHHHLDHMGGLDDLRIYNWRSGRSIPIYGKQEHLEYIRDYSFHYLFDEAIQKGGGLSDLELIPIEERFELGGLQFEPLPVMHGGLKIYGYRFLNCAYISDVSAIPEETMERLVDLEVLIVDALRFKEHATHFSLAQALQLIEKLRPRRSYLTHISHQFKHSVVEPLFSDPKSEYFSEQEVYLSFDGLRLEL